MRTLGSSPAAKREVPAMTDNVSRVQRDSAAPVVNLPNVLTMARLVFVPIFIILALQDSWVTKWVAFVIFALASITDHLDGHLARSWNQITDFGRIVDPIADKALTLGGFVLLSWLVRDDPDRCARARHHRDARLFPAPWRRCLGELDG